MGENRDENWATVGYHSGVRKGHELEGVKSEDYGSTAKKPLELEWKDSVSFQRSLNCMPYRIDATMLKIPERIQRPDRIKHVFSRKALKVQNDRQGRPQNPDVTPKSDADRMKIMVVSQNYTTKIVQIFNHLTLDMSSSLLPLASSTVKENANEDTNPKITPPYRFQPFLLVRVLSERLISTGIL